MTPPLRVTLTVELPDEWVKRLETLGDPAEVLHELADHAQQGVYRPGAWEREWLLQAFGYDFLDQLEPDPAAPPQTGWQRPKR